MTEVNAVTGGVAPNATDGAPKAVPGTPGNPTVLDPPNENDSAAATAAKQEIQERANPENREERAAEGQLPFGKVVRVADVDLKEEKVDMAGVRIDPITGIAVSQIDHASRDATPIGPDKLRTWPIAAFDSRKLKGHETVTITGANVIVADDQVDGYDRPADENDGMPESTKQELEAGRKALAGEKVERRDPVAGEDNKTL